MIEKFDAVDLIKTKRDGGELSPAQLQWLVDAYTRGYVADEQMSAMTMAIFLNGMTPAEIRELTLAMVASGERLDFSGLSRRRRPTSTRPAGSATRSRSRSRRSSHPSGSPSRSSPAAVSATPAAPSTSSRASPAGARRLSNEEFMAQLGEVGAVICAAGADLAPADGKLYALRDITGTVEAIPLIASSIMSKKIAEGTAALVLDVKFGSGAFMQDPARARELAETMVRLGNDAGVATRALLTDMNVPLGLAIGNANEVRESVEVLAGGGPADVVELTVELAREMLDLAGIRNADVESALKDGRAMDTWRAHDPRAGWGSGCGAAGREGDARRPRRQRRHPGQAGGAAVRHRRLASRRRPGSQGGSRAARVRHRPARQAG